MTSIKRRLLLLTIVFGLLFIVSLGTFFQGSRSDHSIAIGSKNDTEGIILAEVVAQLIENRTELTVRRNPALEGTFICFNAIRNQAVDLYIEYTGTAYTAILKRSVEGKKKDEILRELRAVYREKYDLVWLDPLGFQNAYVILMNPQKAEELHIKTLSDLSTALEQGCKLKVAIDPEFYAREEMAILKERYQMDFPDLKIMDHTLLYMTLRNGLIDLINGYGTDGMARGFTVLIDDLEKLPAYEAVPIARREILETFPQLRGLLGELSGRISEEQMRQMNYDVERKGESIYSVAHNFLLNESLIN
ncbi:MAG: Glycine betaine/carnitine/choline-binding protein OpuCC [Chlamydiae bacterium]|nr:Glycine betaine/carnitine/choline-binding protein OpuCC [Chlamydiota bacterium]